MSPKTSKDSRDISPEKWTLSSSYLEPGLFELSRGLIPQRRMVSLPIIEDLNVCEKGMMSIGVSPPLRVADQLGFEQMGKWNL